MTGVTDALGRSGSGRYLLLNRVVNPVVRLILRSPLHGLLSDAVLLLTYRGRRSGRAYTLPVQYARDGDTLYLLPGGPQRKTWWRNLRGGARVQLRVRGRSQSAAACVLIGREDPGAVATGVAAYVRRFPRTAQMYHVRLEHDGRPVASDLQTAVHAAVIVKLTPVRGPE